MRLYAPRHWLLKHAPGRTAVSRSGNHRVERHVSASGLRLCAAEDLPRGDPQRLLAPATGPEISAGVVGAVQLQVDAQAAVPALQARRESSMHPIKRWQGAVQRESERVGEGRVCTLKKLSMLLAPIDY